MNAAERTDRQSRVAKGCRWLDKEYGDVWEVERAYRKGVRLVSLRTKTTMVIADSWKLVLSKSMRPLRGAEFRRSFEICEGDAPIKLVRGRLPGVKALARGGQ